MAKPYTIIMIDGKGTGKIPNDRCKITTQTTGYHNDSINPQTIIVYHE